MMHTIRQQPDMGSLSGLEERALLYVNEYAIPSQVKKGDTIFRQGDPAIRGHFITRGIIALRRYHKGGMVVPHIAHKSNWVGLAPVLHPDFDSYLNEALALEDSSLLSVDARDINELDRISPKFRRLVEQDLVGTIILLYQNAVYAQLNSYNKLMRFLVDYAKATTYGEEDMQDMHIDLTHEDIGTIIGISRESTSKNLSRLKEEGLVQSSRRGVKFNLQGMIEHME